jgi:hypothetical protein
LVNTACQAVLYWPESSPNPNTISWVDSVPAWINTATIARPNAAS